VTLLDAYALIAFLIGGPAAAQVRSLLRDGGTAVATANLVEVLDVCERDNDLPIKRTMEILEPLFDGPLVAMSLDFAVAQRAAEIRARHYHRSSRAISLADAVLIASARQNDEIATADRRPRRSQRRDRQDDCAACPGLSHPRAGPGTRPGSLAAASAGRRVPVLAPGLVLRVSRSVLGEGTMYAWVFSSI
jgi:predicted nucleic acid-binding protein